jgi:hypothetical protein
MYKERETNESPINSSKDVIRAKKKEDKIE